MRLKQARTSFNNPGALSVLRMPGILAILVQSCLVLWIVSRRDFPHQKANCPESPRKVYEKIFSDSIFFKGFEP